MRRPTRRDFLRSAAGVGAALMVPGVVSCSSGDSAKRLQWWSWGDRVYWLQRAFAIYKQQRHVDFDIDWIYLPFQQMHDKLLIAAEAGTAAPDVSEVEISQFGRFIKGKSIFVDLRPKLESMGALEKLVQPSATDPWSWQGHIYGIGNELNATVMSYRWDLFEKAHVTLPITTYDQFREEAIRYHRDTGDYLMAVPTQDTGTSSWNLWWMQVLQQKSGFFDAQDRPTLDSPESLRTLTWQQQALKEGWAIPTPIQQAEWIAFSSGKVASMLASSWYFAGNIETNDPQTAGKWRLQLMPTWEGGQQRAATWGGTGDCVLKSSPYIKEAVDFLTWATTTTEAVLIDFDHRQTFPTWKPAFRVPRVTARVKFFDNQRVGKLLEQAANDIPKWYNSPFWPEVTDVMLRVGITPALAQGQTVEQALRNAQSQAESIVNFESASNS